MKVKPPQEDGRTKALRERAEARAEQEVVSETQRRLEDDTASFARRFGARAAVGGLPSGGFRPAGIFNAFGGSPGNYRAQSFYR